MNRTVRLAALSLVLLIAPTQVDAAAPGQKFKNCDALRKAFPAGVASSAKAAKGTAAKVNAKVYASNKGLDRDRDGIACET